MLAFVKLLISFSISMYFLCGMFVQLFELQSKRFTNFHYYYYNTASCWRIIRVMAPLIIKELIKCFDTVNCLAFTVELKHDHLCIISSSSLNFSPYILPKSSRKWEKCILGKHAEHASQVNMPCVISCWQTCCYSVSLPRCPCGLDVKKTQVSYLLAKPWGKTLLEHDLIKATGHLPRTFWGWSVIYL